MMKVCAILFVLLALICSCKEQLSNRQIFERSLDKNLEIITQYAQTDSDKSEMKAFGVYVLNSLYNIDSTFVRMDGKTLDEFIKCHMDSLTNAYQERRIKSTLMSCKQLFDKYYDKNIKMMSQIISAHHNVKDTAKAIESGKYILNSLFQIDSTFVKMQGDELNDFINQHIDSLRNCCK